MENLLQPELTEVMRLTKRLNKEKEIEKLSKVEVREVGRECMCETCVERRGEEQKKEKEELKKIRRRFYDWMKNPAYLKSLIAQGKISEDDIKKKSFRNKDMGECELIAIAKVSLDEHQIVTNDKGRVFLHPEQNLFDEYASEIGLTVLSSDEWLRQIGHIK